LPRERKKGNLFLMKGDRWECFLVHSLHVYAWTIECSKCRHQVELGTDGSLAPNVPKHPEQCPGCGVTYGDNYFKSGIPFYLRDDTAEIISGRLPPGAMYYSEHWDGQQTGPDGKNLVVFIPHYVKDQIAPEGQPWHVDSIAGNCTVLCKCGESYHRHNLGEVPNCKKFDPVDNRAHRCWVRTGIAPNVHVSKEGLTCGAGGGSIQGTNWHGFLRHGVLYEE
jgi:hypothetical protein